ncbi:MAG: PorV/PorQ family protein [Elusimicrobiota bacterium]
MSRETGKKARLRWRRALRKAGPLRAALALLVVSALWEPLRAAGKDAGTTSAPFLKLAVGGRAAALGEAYSALVDNAEALAWNPAALTRVANRSLSFMHAAYVDAGYFDYLGYAQRNEGEDAFGFGVKYFSAGEVVERDPEGRDTGRFTPNDAAFMAGYAVEYHGYSFGTVWKYVRSTLQKSAGTGAFDIGAMSPDLLGGRVRLAATAVNIGGKLRFEEARESLPFAFRLGSAFKASNQWNLTADAVLPKDNNPYGAGGMEYNIPLSPTLSLDARAGVLLLPVLSDLKGFAGAALGFGLNFHRINFDYAFVPMGELELTHRISIAHQF